MVIEAIVSPSLTAVAVACTPAEGAAIVTATAPSKPVPAAVTVILSTGFAVTAVAAL